MIFKTLYLGGQSTLFRVKIALESFYLVLLVLYDKSLHFYFMDESFFRFVLLLKPRYLIFQLNYSLVCIIPEVLVLVLELGYLHCDIFSLVNKVADAEALKDSGVSKPITVCRC